MRPVKAMREAAARWVVEPHRAHEVSAAAASVLVLDATESPLKICRQAIEHRLAHVDVYGLDVPANAVEPLARAMAAAWERESARVGWRCADCDGSIFSCTCKR